MAEFKLIANDLPLEPDHLGESVIVVPKNNMVVIRVDDIIKSSFPPYYQQQGYVIGDIKIVNHGLQKDNILNNPFNIAILYNDFAMGTVINYDQNGVLIWAEVSAQNIEDGKFQVGGTNLGLDYVSFVAKAINPSTKVQSNYSTVQGKLWINVVPENNQPPSRVGDGYERFDLGVSKVFSVDMFTTKTTPQYQDPENDKPFELKILSLPNIGRLTYKGNICAVNDIIPMIDIGLGLLRYEDMGNANLQSTVVFQFAVSDVGSKKFTS